MPVHRTVPCKPDSDLECARRGQAGTNTTSANECRRTYRSSNDTGGCKRTNATRAHQGGSMLLTAVILLILLPVVAGIEVRCEQISRDRWLSIQRTLRGQREHPGETQQYSPEAHSYSWKSSAPDWIGKACYYGWIFLMGMWLVSYCETRSNQANVKAQVRPPNNER